MTHLAKWLVLVVAWLAAGAQASTPIPVLITQRDGTTVPFTLESALYRDGQRSATWGQLWLEINGVSTVVPLERIVRAQLVSPGTPTVWRFTLDDGRVFDGFVANDDARLRFCGRTEFGGQACHESFPTLPDQQPILAVVFDLEAPGPDLRYSGVVPGWVVEVPGWRLETRWVTADAWLTTEAQRFQRGCVRTEELSWSLHHGGNMASRIAGDADFAAMLASLANASYPTYGTLLLDGPLTSLDYLTFRSSDGRLFGVLRVVDSFDVSQRLVTICHAQ